jgi:phage terminase small subunit
MMQVRRQQFVLEYMVDLVPSAAAIRAGYPVASARLEAMKLMRDPDIARAIDKELADRARRTRITADRVLDELACTGFSNVQELFGTDNALLPVWEWPEAAARAVASVEVNEIYEGTGDKRVWVGQTKRVKLWSKTTLARHFKMLTDNVTVGPSDAFIEMIARARARAIDASPKATDGDL